jgi:DNA-binding NtrC family response regulator
MPLSVLIVEAMPELGQLWAAALARQGMAVRILPDADSAIADLGAHQPDVIVADLDLPESGAMAVADYAAYRHPEARVIFVTASSFFSDGSIFAHSPNACACLPTRTAPNDLAAVVGFHAARTALARG